jgi:hypothetical protein
MKKKIYIHGIPADGTRETAKLIADLFERLQDVGYTRVVVTT